MQQNGSLLLFLLHRRHNSKKHIEGRFEEGVELKGSSHLWSLNEAPLATPPRPPIWRELNYHQHTPTYMHR